MVTPDKERRYIGGAIINLTNEMRKRLWARVKAGAKPVRGVAAKPGTEWLKPGLIGRVRPSDVGPFAYVPWSWRNEYASLPSGHSTTAFAAAVAIAAIWPKARIPMLVYAAIIALSRVVITAHFVSDVVAAAFVGGFGAILVRNWYASRGLAFVPEFDGSVRAKPGPSWRRIKSVAAKLSGR